MIFAHLLGIFVGIVVFVLAAHRGS
jgi:hypothetical protein